MEKQFESRKIRAHTMKLIILDRDGVINQDRDDFVKSVDEWIPIEGSMDAIAFLTQAGYTIAVATNQSGIGRKYFTVQDLTEMHAKMHRLAVQAGGTIDGIWFCPHTAADNCECRKPKPGMIIDIIERFKANAAETWLVGDSLRAKNETSVALGQTCANLSWNSGGEGRAALRHSRRANFGFVDGSARSLGAGDMHKVHPQFEAWYLDDMIAVMQLPPYSL